MFGGVSIMRIAVAEFAFCFAFGLFALAPATHAQTVAVSRPTPADNQVTQSPAAPATEKVFRNVALGMSPDDVESLLGDPKIKDERGFLYNLSDSETAQIEIGPEKKVTAVAFMFANGKGAPSLAEVFGAGVTADPQPNGTIYKMVRYEDAGFWISYYAGSGGNAVTTVTIRKLRTAH